MPAEPLKAYVREREEWIQSQPPRPWSFEREKEYHRKFTVRFERWLDRGYGSCLLRERSNAMIVESTLKHFEGERSRLHAWVIMPNHVHVLTSLVGDATLSGLVKSWKGYTSKKINEACGNSGPLWQKGYFDRLVRDWEHFAKCVRYIRNNPTKAGLKQGECLQDESDLAGRTAAE